MGGVPAADASTPPYFPHKDSKRRCLKGKHFPALTLVGVLPRAAGEGAQQRDSELRGTWFGSDVPWHCHSVPSRGTDPVCHTEAGSRAGTMGSHGQSLSRSRLLTMRAAARAGEAGTAAANALDEGSTRRRDRRLSDAPRPLSCRWAPAGAQPRGASRCPVAVVTRPPSQSCRVLSPQHHPSRVCQHRGLSVVPPTGCRRPRCCHRRRCCSHLRHGDTRWPF